jgi:hypothetical protein
LMTATATPCPKPRLPVLAAPGLYDCDLHADRWRALWFSRAISPMLSPGAVTPDRPEAAAPCCEIRGDT